jgi:hypothetical protein
MGALIERPSGRFPRGQVVLWALLSTEDALGRFPLLVIVPVVAAIIGTSWASAHPDTITVNGHHVADAPSFSGALSTTLIAGASGVVLLLVLCVACKALIYRVFHRGTGWRAGFRDTGQPEMRCAGRNPVPAEALVTGWCMIRLPCGVLVESDQPGDLAQLRDRAGQVVTGEFSKESGTYETRWFATEGKRFSHEIARARRTFSFTTDDATAPTTVRKRRRAQKRGRRRVTRRG